MTLMMTSNFDILDMADSSHLKHGVVEKSAVTEIRVGDPVYAQRLYLHQRINDIFLYFIGKKVKVEDT